MRTGGASPPGLDRQTLMTVIAIGGFIWILVMLWPRLVTRLWPMSAEAARTEIETSVARERAQLPRQVDAATRLVAVGHEGMTIISELELDTASYEIGASAPALAQAKQATLSKLCGSDRLQPLLAAGVHYRYLYRGADGQEIGRFELGQGDCR
jgi:hypothetical protein